MPLTCHHPAWLLSHPAFWWKSRSLFFDCLLPRDHIILFIGLLVSPGCCAVVWFLDSFPGLQNHLWSCLQINSRGEIGTFQQQPSIPVSLWYLWAVALPDCNCICWVAAHKRHACFNCVWLLAAECNRHTNGKIR